MVWLMPRLLTALAVAAVAALIGHLAATLLRLPTTGWGRAWAGPAAFGGHRTAARCTRPHKQADGRAPNAARQDERRRQHDSQEVSVQLGHSSPIP